MRIRMIFATRGEDGTDWKVGEIREASPAYAREMVRQGRAEAVDPEVTQTREPAPSKKS